MENKRLVENFSSRVSTAYFTVTSNDEEYRDHRLNDIDLGYIMCVYDVLNKHSIEIDDEIVNRYNYVVYAERLIRLYDKTLPGNSSWLPFYSSNAKEIKELLLCREQSSDRISLVGRPLEPFFYHIMNHIPFEEIIEVLAKVNIDYSFVISDDSCTPFIGGRTRETLFENVKSNCSDKRLEAIESIEDEKNYRTFIEICRDNGIVIITRKRSDSDFDFEFFCPGIMNDYQREHLCRVASKLSQVGNPSNNLKAFIDDIRTTVRKDILGYVRKPRRTKKQETSEK